MNAQKKTALVIMGATGDLTQRKLIPSLFKLCQKGRLPANLDIIGFARREWDDEYFRQEMREGIQAFTPDQFIQSDWDHFSQRLHFFQGNFTNKEDFDRLSEYMHRHYGGHENHTYYMATSPEFFKTTIGYLADCNLDDAGKNKIIIEKPFGSDYTSAHDLNEFIHQTFQEEQIFRIDHYLGKETAQNILFFRFSNSIFEPIWNRNLIDHVQITVAESVDVGHRAGYYDHAGVLRDMFQNHLFQLLTLTAMEPPAAFNATYLRNEKVKVLQAIRPIALEDVVLGQYDGYCQTDRVAPDSRTPTYAAMKLYIDNWRWQGVPFYLRSGKALPDKTSEISIYFRNPPHNLFSFEGGVDQSPNVLSIIIQPNEGIHLSFATKQPDSYKEIQSVNMNFYYSQSFGNEPLPDAYERLLLDAINGDASLFARADEIELAWQLMDPVIRFAEDPNKPSPHQYAKNSWGPQAALKLIESNGGCWLVTQGTAGIICTF
ncbi:MAG TPA: glucose-6-phosphate dehydrogenase [Chloroflexi bacterium]|nr:glucose-6-phosphate dehydrogenase [Chloroflexota bacterium]